MTFFMIWFSTTFSLKLQSDNAGTYVHFVFIYNVLVTSLFICQFSKCTVLQIAKKQGYQIFYQY